MNPFKLTIIFSIILGCTLGCGEKNTEQDENELLYLYKNKFDIDPEKAFENSNLIKTRFSHLLSLKESFTYPFNKLTEQGITIINSNDKLVRLYSYDEYTGGTMQDNTTFVQFRNNKNTISFEELETHSRIKEINEILLKGKKYYMCFGVVKSASQSYLNEILFFSISNDKIEVCTDCISDEYKFINSPSYNIMIEYDSLQQILTFENQSGNSIDNILGDSETEKVILKLAESKFIRTN